MNLKRMKLNNEMVRPLKELVGNLLEQLEIAEKRLLSCMKVMNIFKEGLMK